MRNLSKTVVVDTDALIALFNKDDKHAATALSLLEELYKQEVRLLYPSTTVVEAVTAIQRKLTEPDLAAQIIEVMRRNELVTEPVDQAVLEEAVKYFNPKGSKQNTLFDAIVAAIAKRYNADAIFSFDEWYTKQNFRLASELV